VSRPVRVRFAPSPTGDLHVGNVRTALFSWAYARHHGGAFVLRVEDTDRARSTEQAYQNCLDSLRWLGLSWDEGPEVGGPYGPYRQSERSEIYRDVAARLLEAGLAYRSYSVEAEIRARKTARGDKTPGYDNFDRELTREQVAGFEAEGRPAVLRLRMPDEPISWTDLVRGDVTFEQQHVPDFVLARADGTPLYPLVNPVDDALMRISHVLRGEDLLPSTPRQIALYRALGEIGVTDGTVPEFGHLPFVMGEGNAKLSKRRPEGSLNAHRDRGYLPEGLLNYLALLGWSLPGEDREVFDLEEMVRAFDLSDVNANPARFDPKKAAAINAAWVRRLDPPDFAQRLLGYLGDNGLVATPPTELQRSAVQAAAPLIQERVVVLADAVPMLRFLLVDEADFAIEPEAAAKALGDDAAEILDAAVRALEALPQWEAAGIEAALKASLVDGLGRKPRQAFAPVRAAVTGRTVSPPLYESMVLLGRDRSLARLRAARSGLRASPAVG
jgi:glutamyl-tRNA synthetase